MTDRPVDWPALYHGGDPEIRLAGARFRRATEGVVREALAWDLNQNRNTVRSLRAHVLVFRDAKLQLDTRARELTEAGNGGER